MNKKRCAHIQENSTRIKNEWNHFNFLVANNKEIKEKRGEDEKQDLREEGVALHERRWPKEQHQKKKKKKKKKKKEEIIHNTEVCEEQEE